jgi:hypothetical protein
MLDKYTYAIEAHEKAIQELAAEQAKVARFGQDEWEDDTVLSFTHQFTVGGTMYSYLAYKIKGFWYLSGRTGSRLTWAQLVEFMKDSDIVWVVTGWKKAY